MARAEARGVVLPEQCRGVVALCLADRCPRLERVVNLAELPDKGLQVARADRSLRVVRPVNPAELARCPRAVPVLPVVDEREVVRWWGALNITGE